MDCFPLDEELEASIPFSNNSVVLAASALLQRLLTYADERNLQSVDVLLTSIWLFLREEKYQRCNPGVEISQNYQEKQNDKDKTETEHLSAVSYAEKETEVENALLEPNSEVTKKVEKEESIHLYKITFTEKETQTENFVLEVYSEGSKVAREDRRDNESSVKQNHIANLDMTIEKVTNETAVKLSDKDGSDSDEAEIHTLVTPESLKELSSTELQYSIQNSGSSENKMKVRNHLLSKPSVSPKITGRRIEVEKTDLLENVFENPPVLTPIITQKETTNDLEKETVDDTCSQFIKNCIKCKAQGSYCGCDTSCAASVNEENINNNLEVEVPAQHPSFLEESDTRMKILDEKTFQMSSNDGLTYGESIVIERVDSDDFDAKMIVTNDESFDIFKRTKCFSKTNSFNYRLRSEFYQMENKNNDVEATVVDNNLIIANETYAESENPLCETSDISPETCEKDTPEKPNRESFGGIVGPDNDSELKIINVAGGVTFYDEPCQENEPNVRVIDYINKPTVSIYNPFSYSGLPPIRSSRMTPYSDVVYSSYSSFPGTYMSVDPRLTAQNCPQYFIPNNLNVTGMVLGTNQGGQLFQAAESSNQFENVPANLNQRSQYYLPQASDIADFNEPVQVKSKSKIIMATQTKLKKKKKKEFISESQSPIKEYYNVRDKHGKFIKMEKIPNNSRYSSCSPRRQKIHLKTQEKLDELTGSVYKDGNHAVVPREPLSDGTASTLENGTETQTKLIVRQLQKEYKETDEKLRALLAKKNMKPAKDMTERERKLHKAYERKRLNLLKKLRLHKREIRKHKKPKIVMRDKGIYLNSSGLSEEYTVVTIKSPVTDSSETDVASKSDQETGSKQSEESHQRSLKTKICLKESKGKKLMKMKKSFDKGKTIPLDHSNSKIKSAKQKLAAKKILKIKKAKTKILKETAGKNKLNLKQITDGASENMANSNDPEETEGIQRKRGRGRPRKDEKVLKSKKQKKVRVNSILKKTGKKTRAFTQLMKEKKEKEREEAKETIFMYHGERGAKLAAQQKISAYNESLSMDNAAKGDS